MAQRYFKFVISTLFAGLLTISTASAERLSISTWGSPLHPQVAEFIPAFTEALKEKSDGEFRLRVFQGGEMVKQEFVPTAIPQGTVDISLTTMDTWSGRIPEVTILTTPLWDKSMDWTLENLVPGNPVFDYFNNKLQEQGTVLLSMFDIGPAVISSRQSIKVPDDLKGKSIRVYSRGAGLVIQELGGSPITMGVGDVYSALQRGTIDGAMGGLGGAVGLKHYEVTDYMLAQSGVIGSLIHAYVMNKQKFDRLSPELRDALLDAVAEARGHMQEQLISIYDQQVQEVRDAGSTVTNLDPTSPEWDKWINALSDFTAQARQDYPADLTELISAN